MHMRRFSFGKWAFLEHWVPLPSCRAHVLPGYLHKLQQEGQELFVILLLEYAHCMATDLEGHDSSQEVTPTAGSH